LTWIQGPAGADGYTGRSSLADRRPIRSPGAAQSGSA
jgi:hypothetical protein